MSNVMSDAETFDTIMSWVKTVVFIVVAIWVINDIEQNPDSGIRAILADHTDIVSPSYKKAKSGCDRLARENQDSLELVSLESENYGAKNGKRFVVYQTMMFGEPRQRLCVHWGDQMMFPPILQQASYMQ